MKILTVQMVAERLGCSDRTVRRICAAYGIGTQAGRAYVLNESEVKKVKANLHGVPGNPEFGEEFGNGEKAKAAKRRRQE